MVVDECASCDGNGDIDFSSTALKDITGYSWDRKRIEVRQAWFADAALRQGTSRGPASVPTGYGCLPMEGRASAPAQPALHTCSTSSKLHTAGLQLCLIPFLSVAAVGVDQLR
jgi:hypothetical protein